MDCTFCFAPAVTYVHDAYADFPACRKHAYEWAPDFDFVDTDLATPSQEERDGDL